VSDEFSADYPSPLHEEYPSLCAVGARTRTSVPELTSLAIHPRL